MAMVVNHNLPATNAYRHLGINNSKMSKSIEKLSSGLAINRAGDNAAGLAVSEKMRAQISGIDQAVKNAQDGISMVQTFEGALTETDSILQRMRTLAAQSANGTYQDDVDREAIQLEFDQLNDELNQIADTDFNGVVALNGGQMADGLKQIGGEFNYSKAAARPTVTSLNKFGDVTNAKANTVNSYKGPSEDTTVTYAYNGDGKWVNTYNSTVINANENGGFSGVFGDTVSLDSTKLKAGDTITVEYKAYQEAVKAAPKTGDATVSNNAAAADKALVTVGETDNFKLNTTIKDEAMSSTLEAAFKTLDSATLKHSAAVGTTAKPAANTDITFAGTAPAGNAINTTVGDANAASVKSTAANQLNALYDKNTGKVSFYFNEKNDTEVKSGVLLGEFTYSAVENKTAAAVDVTYDLNVKMPENKGAVVGDVTVKDREATDVEVAELLDKLSKTGVSTSNSYDQSRATMTYTDNITLQVGARTKDSVNFTFAYASDGLGTLKADLDCSARGLGTDQLSLSTQKSANAAIDKIDNAINKVSMVRGSFGAMQNRLEHKVDNLNVASENLTAAESAIRDTDMAKEMMNFTKSQILSQASQAMLAQANQLPQGVLQLLG